MSQNGEKVIALATTIMDAVMRQTVPTATQTQRRRKAKAKARKEKEKARREKAKERIKIKAKEKENRTEEEARKEVQVEIANLNREDAAHQVNPMQNHAWPTRKAPVNLGKTVINGTRQNADITTMGLAT